MSKLSDILAAPIAHLGATDPVTATDLRRVLGEIAQTFSDQETRIEDFEDLVDGTPAPQNESEPVPEPTPDPVVEPDDEDPAEAETP